MRTGRAGRRGRASAGSPRRRQVACQESSRCWSRARYRSPRPATRCPRTRCRCGGRNSTGSHWVSSPAAYPNRRAVEAALRAAGVGMPVVCGTPAYVTVCALVGAGPGAGLVPRMVAGDAAVAPGVRPLAPPGLHRTIAPAWRPQGGRCGHGTGTAQGIMIHTVLPPSAVGVTSTRPPDSQVR
ncbi:LysR family transcriptional regulator substrate-binding protein [Actinacidiphila polyblastidii]|uniref:LysR family transcriptional regulator substrate-binding protein n=1 Tax=Actinacidiphila polyblastidii TaxID=3110430 RepID=UPI0039BD896A